MADTDIVQVIAEARVDARSLSEFVFKPAGFKVTRRLAPTVDTLQFYIDRFDDIATSASSEISEAIKTSILTSGFSIVDSFESGATITQRNQALRHAATGNLYRWAGDLPKVVPASSTPLTSGGIGNNSWLVVSDLVLADGLKSTTGASLVSIKDKTVYEMLSPYVAHVFLESFRGTGFSDSQTINAALTHIRTNLAGKITRLVFQANKTYIYDSTGDVSGISNLTIDLNSATLKRAPASATKATLSGDIGTGQGGFFVDAVPLNWNIGDTLVAYNGVSDAEITKLNTVITTLNRGANKVGTVGGFGRTATWIDIIPAGVTIAKKYVCFAGSRSDGVSAATDKQIKIINGTIDGNRVQQENYSWYFNSEISLNGNGCAVSNVHFKEIAGECIVGHGIDVNSCRFDYLNGSAFHLSVHDDTVADGSISRFRNNYVDKVCRISTAVNGHSEGAITFSWGAGRLIIEGNELKKGAESVLGGFGLEATNPDKWLIVKNNICADFKSIFHSLADGQSGVILADNIFANCGNNETTLRKLTADINSTVGHNAFVDGTVAGGRQRIREGIAGTATSKHPSSVFHFGSDVGNLETRLSGVVSIADSGNALLALGSGDNKQTGIAYFTPSGATSGSFFSLWDSAANSYKLWGNTAGAKVHIDKAKLKLDTSSTAYMPIHADNAAALAAGLTAGDVYRTSLGALMVCF